MNNTDWSGLLSYPSLLCEGLVQNQHEHDALQRAFKYSNLTATSIKRWLFNQRGHFRISYLSHLFMSGYTRNRCDLFNLDVLPQDLQNIILFYLNVIFIKLYNSNHSKRSEIMTLNTNFNMNNLLKLLQYQQHQSYTKWQQNNHSNTMRLYARFKDVESLYSVERNGQRLSDINVSDHQKKRWVQIPSDSYSKLSLKSMDDQLAYDQVLEFGVDRVKTIHYDVGVKCQYKWSFMAQEQSKQNALSNLDWLCSLNTGDVINVYDERVGRWIEGVVCLRGYDRFYVRCLHQDKVIEIESVGQHNLCKMQRHYDVVDDMDIMQYNASCELVRCEWITCFNKSAFCPITIE